MCRAGAKAGLSDPTLVRRNGEAHQTKATPGINSAYQKWYNKSMLSRFAVMRNMITAYNGEPMRKSFSAKSRFLTRVEYRGKSQYLVY